MLISILTLTSWLACIEPPPTATEGGTEPGGAAKPGAPEPGGEPGEVPADAVEPNPEAAVVPTPHDGGSNGAPKVMYTQDSVPNGVTLHSTSNFCSLSPIDSEEEEARSSYWY